VRLAGGDQQGVELVEEDRIGGQVRLQERPGLLVAGAGRQQSMTGQDTARVGVGHEHRAPRRVEQDRVGGLRSQPGHAQQLASQRGQRRPSHRPDLAAVTGQQPAGEVQQATRLQAVRPRRAHQRGQRGGLGGGEPTRREQAARAQRGDRAGRPGPGGVLRQDRADRDLERRAGRPPALGPVPAQQRPVEAQQAGLDAIARRAGDPPPPAQHGTA
jgi:hypothetical protein